MTPGKAGGLFGERLKGVDNTTSRLKAAYYSTNFIWSYRSSSASWFRMYALTIASSNPTVET